MPAQNSTEEQLAYLRILAEEQEYDCSDLNPRTIMQIVQVANFMGLYDAADFLETHKTLDWSAS